MRKTKKRLMVLAILALSFTILLPMSAEAAGKVKLSATRKTITTGQSCTISLKNNKRKVSWSATNSRIKITKKTKTYAKIKGMKKGTVYLKAKVGGKTYKCKVTVKNVKKSNITTGKKNALKAAKRYLSVMPFSYEGLIKQLKYEGYTQNQAAYAAKNCGANWNLQAQKAAKQYLKTMPFSYKGLVKQLEYEKYTHKQAVYGVNRCGANWSRQAARMAKSYLDMMPFSRDALIKQLEYEGFTHKQAVYGAEQNGY